VVVGAAVTITAFRRTWATVVPLKARGPMTPQRSMMSKKMAQSSAVFLWGTNRNGPCTSRAQGEGNDDVHVKRVLPYQCEVCPNASIAVSSKSRSGH